MYRQRWNKRKILERFDFLAPWILRPIYIHTYILYCLGYRSQCIFLLD